MLEAPRPTKREAAYAGDTSEDQEEPGARVPYGWLPQLEGREGAFQRQTLERMDETRGLSFLYEIGVVVTALDV